jgi:DNA-binding MarR family transcriptional regulator
VTEILAATRADASTELPGFILERTAKRMKQFFQQQLAAAEAGITIDQWVILQVLDRQEGLSQLEIARATYKDAPTVTRIIDLLCQKELTRRLPDPADRRRFNIQLTPAGRDKIEAVLPVIQAARRQAWQGLPAAELGRLADILNAVFDNLGPSADE